MPVSMGCTQKVSLELYSGSYRSIIANDLTHIVSASVVNIAVSTLRKIVHSKWIIFLSTSLIQSSSFFIIPFHLLPTAILSGSLGCKNLSVFTPNAQQTISYSGNVNLLFPFNARLSFWSFIPVFSLINV